MTSLSGATTRGIFQSSEEERSNLPQVRSNVELGETPARFTQRPRPTLSYGPLLGSDRTKPTGITSGKGSSALLFLTHFILSSYAHLKKYHFAYKLINTYLSTQHNHYTTPSRIEIARKHRWCLRLKCREDKTVLTHLNCLISCSFY